MVCKTINSGFESRPVLQNSDYEPSNNQLHQERGAHRWICTDVHDPRRVLARYGVDRIGSDWDLGRDRALVGTWKNERRKTAYHRQRRQETNLWLASFRKECVQCGEDDPVVLDFHHRDPTQKRFQLTGSLCYSRSRESLLKEIAKCDVLCANCHRKEEHRIRVQNSLRSRAEVSLSVS